MSTQKEPNARRAFLSQLNSVIVLLTGIIAQLNDEKCPSLSEIDDCTKELKKLYQFQLQVQQDVISPLLKCLDDFLSIKSMKEIRDEGMEDLKGKAKELREKLRITKICDIEFLNPSFAPYKQIIEIIKLQASEQQTPKEMEQEDQLIKLLPSTIGKDTLLRIACRRFFLECTTDVNTKTIQANQDNVPLPKEVPSSSTSEGCVPSHIECADAVVNAKVISEEKQQEPGNHVLQITSIMKRADHRGKDVIESPSAEAISPLKGENPFSEDPVPSLDTNSASSEEDYLGDVLDGDPSYYQLHKTKVWQNLLLLAKTQPREMVIWRTAIAYMSHFVVFEKKMVSDFIGSFLAKKYNKEKLAKVLSEMFDKLVEWGVFGFFSATSEVKEEILPSKVYCFTETAEKEVKSIAKILKNPLFPVVTLDSDPSGAEGMKKIGLYKLTQKYTNGKLTELSEVLSGKHHTTLLDKVLGKDFDFFMKAELSLERGIAWTGKFYALYLKLNQQQPRWYVIYYSKLFEVGAHELECHNMPLLLFCVAQNDLPNEDSVKKLPVNYVAGNMLFLLRDGKCFVRHFEVWRPLDGTFDSLFKASDHKEQSKVDHKEQSKVDQNISELQEATAAVHPVPNSLPFADTVESKGNDPVNHLKVDTAGDEIQYISKPDIETHEMDQGEHSVDDGSVPPDFQVQSLLQENSQSLEQIADVLPPESQNLEFPLKPDKEEILYNIPSIPFLEDNLDIAPKMSVKEYANTMLLDENLDPQKDHERFFTLIYKILKEGQQTEYKDEIVTSSIGDAVIVCKALSMTEKHSGPYSDALIKFAYAINSDIHAPRTYSGYTLPSVIDTEFGCARVIKQAVLLNALFAPSQERDFALVTYAKAFLTDRKTSEEPEEIRDVFLALLSIHGNNPGKGYTPPILANFSKHDSQEEILSSLSRDRPEFAGGQHHLH